MFLFLDFDGVLHPQYDGVPTPVGEVFCHLSLFESIMRDFPPAEIIISSTWRYQFSIEELRSKFSPDIAARIVGMTPQTEQDEREYVQARREVEILEWLAISGRSDAAWLFDKHRDRLVHCTWYVGLNDTVEFKLRSALASLVSQHPIFDRNINFAARK